MALTIVLGFVSIAHIALIKMNLIAEIKSWFGPSKVRKSFKSMFDPSIRIQSWNQLIGGPIFGTVTPNLSQSGK